MTLKIRHLQLRAMTAKGIFGADIPFSSGLNIIWADNTKGKSTCMQGMLYAFGLERMLSPKREVPLPHAMTAYVKTDAEEEISVLESSIAVEIENGSGQVIVIRRPVKTALDRRLITVEFGAGLTAPQNDYPTRKFFVLDPGAASREDGFHFFLEDFLGWTLPTVKRYDAPETKLYLETVFPMFWVEQKYGWSAIPAAIPTYLRIREVHKRSFEFLLDLDVHKLELKRQRLDESFAANLREWRLQVDDLDRSTKRNAAKIEGVPERPVANPETLGAIKLTVAEHGQWVGVAALVNALKARISQIETAPIQEQKISSPELMARLRALSENIDKINLRRIQVANDRQIRKVDISSLQRRIFALKEDLQKNQDVQKLQRYSGSAVELTPDHCPTCEQALRDTLLSQEALTSVMPIDDNIEYIRAQLKMFQDMYASGEADLSESEIEGSALDRELEEAYSQVRSIRSELVSPDNSPSVVLIEERVRIEARIRELDKLRSDFEDAIEKLGEICEGYASLLGELNKLPGDKLTDGDNAKLRKFEGLLQTQAEQYGFSTFNPADLEISDDTYRPQKQGFEIGFETSASDSIRLKWAYQIGLLEVAATSNTNHPGILLFDEPRQQSSAKLSFERLLSRASKSAQRGQQVIFSTSEDLNILNSITDGIECSKKIFQGYILKRIG